MKAIALFWSFVLFMIFANTASAGTVVKILALGDSYTIGESVAVEGRWPLQLVSQLAQHQVTASAEIIAATGWTTVALERAVESSPLNIPYDMVTLLIGVNDQFRGININAYESNFTRLLQSSIQYAGGQANHVMVLSIPDYGVTPFARGRNPARIGREIDDYNVINKRITQQFGAQYLDITPISRDAEKDLTLIARDGLHPSAKMYQRWVEKALPIVLNLINEP